MHTHTTISQNLAQSYDAIADKFHHTRKRHRPEFDRILSQLPKNQHIMIVELWCGDGRLYGFLRDHIDCTYIWVDISHELILLARTQYPQATWICDDMMNYMSGVEQQSCDVIIMIASYNHIYGPARAQLMGLLYRGLEYGGKLIMTNRSRSTRFIAQYRKQRVISRMHFWQRNDILIPFRVWDTIVRRYYHMFTRNELLSLHRQAWFYVHIFWYTDHSWSLIQHRRTAKNIFTCAIKSIGKS